MILGILSLVLEAALIWRARAGRFLARFPLFYSYVAFIFVGSAGTYAAQWLWPRYYASAFWFYYIVSLLAEFALLVEISGHIFKPYRAIRALGWTVTLCVTAAFFALYILPALTQSQPSRALILELVKRSSLTKGVIIVTLLASARYFGLPMSRNVSGMMAGLGIYLATNMVNFELLERLGPARYFSTFTLVGPLSYSLGLLVWTIALWRYEPLVPALRRIQAGEVAASELLTGQLERFDTSLVRLLRK